MPGDRLSLPARVGDGFDDVRTKAVKAVPWLTDLLQRHRVAGDAAAVELTRRLADCRDDTERRAAALTLTLTAEPTGWHPEPAPLMSGTRGWTPAEVGAMLAAITDPEAASRFAEWLPPVLEAAEGLARTERRAVGPWLNHARLVLGQDEAIDPKRRRELRSRVRMLLGGADKYGLPKGVLPAHDPWAAPLREWLERSAGPVPAALVMHAATLSGPRPGREWRRRCLLLLEHASARDVVERCLLGLATGETMCNRTFERRPWDGAFHIHYLVHPDHSDLARGLVWAAALTGGAAEVPSLTALTERAADRREEVNEELKLAGAAINALGDIDDPSALEALWRLRAEIRHRGLHKQVDTALKAAAGRQGITPEQLIERGVPAHGLGDGGSLAWSLGEHRAVLAIEDPVTVRLTYATADGRAQRSVPPALRESHPDEVEELRALLKRVRGTLSGERARIEGLMSAERDWPYAEWARHYRDHPVTGAVTRGLVWEFEGAGGEWTAATPTGRVLVTAGGQELPEPAEGTRVRLWHPIRASGPQIGAWRDFVTGNRMRQPFKQAFREIYLLTPAELETGGHSNRFAAHIVHYRQLYALFRARGWQAAFLGAYDGGYAEEAIGVFAGGAWRAGFHHETAGEHYDGPSPVYAATDRIRFQRRDGRQWLDAPLEAVPPVVFSEAMRDVDLFVGVTSIAADPDWTDQGDGRFDAYWHTATFGELTGGAEVRRDALERILPRTKIADRCALEGRYLVVRGGLRTYKIHLGSANILMEPDDSYLCLVPSRRKGAGTVFLPFEDERLALILSKAFLLAHDVGITDPTILQQIKRGT